MNEQRSEDGLFPWGEVYRRFKSRGMDHGDAAFRTDQAEKRFLAELDRANVRAADRSSNEVAELREAVRKLRHFAACCAAGTWEDTQRSAREVLAMTQEFEPTVPSP